MCVFIILSRSVCMCVWVCSAYGGHCWPLAMSVCECAFSSFASFSASFSPRLQLTPGQEYRTTLFLSLLIPLFFLFFLLLAGLQSSLLTACIHFISNWHPLFLVASFGCYWLIVHPVAYGLLHCLVFWLVPIVFWRLPLLHWFPLALIIFSWLLLTFGKHRLSFSFYKKKFLYAYIWKNKQGW